MTEVELLNEIAARADIISVGTPQAASDEGEIDGILWKKVNVVEADAALKRAWRRNFFYYVKDSAQPSEQAFYMQKIPPRTIEPDGEFTQTALNWIYENGHAEFAEIISQDNVREKIKVHLYKSVDATNAELKAAIIWRDGGVNIRYLP